MGADTPDFVQQKAPCVWQSHCGTGASEVCFPFTAVPLLKCVGLLGFRGASLTCVAMSVFVSLGASCSAADLRPFLSGMKVGYICMCLILVVLLALDLISNI